MEKQFTDFSLWKSSSLRIKIMDEENKSLTIIEEKLRFVLLSFFRRVLICLLVLAEG